MTTRDPVRFPIEREALALFEDALLTKWAPRAGWLDGDDTDSSGSSHFDLRAGIAVVDVCGPIDSRASWWWTGYDEIVARVELALMSRAVTGVVLSLDSPGGVAAGMVDTGRAIRALADRYGKPVVAHAGPMACSAAYGLACAADRIMVTADGTVGSVGVIAVVCDRTKQNEQEGLNVAVISSGTQKADGHPDVPLSAAAVARFRARITQLAGMFAGWVGERRGMSADDVLALQGGVAYGADAVTKGLADGVGTLDDAIATAAALAAARTSTQEKTMQTTTAASALDVLAKLRDLTGATDDAEMVATVSTLKARAAQADTMAAELKAARQQLADRDAADASKARAEVLTKHRKRGGLTPAMEADASFMADLAPLSAEALDRVLSKLPTLAVEPVQPPKASASPEDASAKASADELTPEEMEYAKTYGIKPEAMLREKRRQAEVRAARAG